MIPALARFWFAFVTAASAIPISASSTALSRIRRRRSSGTRLQERSPHSGSACRGWRSAIAWCPRRVRRAGIVTGVRNEPVLCAETAGPPGSSEVRIWHEGRPVTRGFRLGAFAEYVLVETSGVALVPEGVPLDAAAAVGYAIQTGIGSVTNVAKTEPGASATILGLGGVGLAIVQGLVLSGAATIIGIDPVAERRARAVRLAPLLCSTPQTPASQNASRL